MSKQRLLTVFGAFGISIGWMLGLFYVRFGDPTWLAAVSAVLVFHGLVFIGVRDW